QWLRRTNQDGIVVHPKQMRFREDGDKSPQDGLEMWRLEFVNLNPLAKDSLRSELRPTEFKELAGEQIGRPRNPWIGRFRNEDIVFAVGDQQVIASVVGDQCRAGIG